VLTNYTMTPRTAFWEVGGIRCLGVKYNKACPCKNRRQDARLESQSLNRIVIVLAVENLPLLGSFENDLALGSNFLPGRLSPLTPRANRVAILLTSESAISPLQRGHQIARIA
jgi:hypothetical protein